MRVVENLNHALREVLAGNPRAFLLGEDLLDPYGGAFKATRGLSTSFPAQVVTTPISESAITGVGAGLALCGDTAIVEIMFGDFVTLAFDQIVNFAAKSVSMYGTRVPMRLIVRLPTGGGRGYGPTHSQSLQKHFIGVPGLDVYEMSPLHDNRAVFAQMIAAERPCVFFEDKVLYTKRMHEVDDLFTWDLIDGVARVHVDTPPDCVIIAPGGVTHRALAAMRRLLLEQEIVCTLLVPSRLHPLDAAPLVAVAREARSVVVAEESTAGGTWGAEVAHALHRELWGVLRNPVALAHSADSIIPTAGHLERAVLLTETTIHDTVLESLK